MNRCQLELFLVFAGFAAAAWSATPQSAPSHPGFMPYSPSRIEWLELWATAHFQHTATSEEPYVIMFLPTGSESITVRVRYTAVLDQPTNNQSAQSLVLQAKRNGIMQQAQLVATGLEQTAKSRGWNWLKVTLDIKNYTQDQDSP